MLPPSTRQCIKPVAQWVIYFNSRQDLVISQTYQTFSFYWLYSGFLLIEYQINMYLFKSQIKYFENIVYVKMSYECLYIVECTIYSNFQE